MLRVAIVIEEENLQSSGFQSALIVRRELVAIHHNPVGLPFACKSNRLTRIIRRSRGVGNAHDLARLGCNPRLDRWM